MVSYWGCGSNDCFLGLRLLHDKMKRLLIFFLFSQLISCDPVLAQVKDLSVYPDSTCCCVGLSWTRDVFYRWLVIRYDGNAVIWKGKSILPDSIIDGLTTGMNFTPIPLVSGIHTFQFVGYNDYNNPLDKTEGSIFTVSYSVKCAKHKKR